VPTGMQLDGAAHAQGGAGLTEVVFSRGRHPGQQPCACSATAVICRRTSEHTCEGARVQFLGQFRSLSAACGPSVCTHGSVQTGVSGAVGRQQECVRAPVREGGRSSLTAALWCQNGELRGSSESIWTWTEANMSWTVFLGVVFFFFLSLTAPSNPFCLLLDMT